MPSASAQTVESTGQHCSSGACPSVPPAEQRHDGAEQAPAQRSAGPTTTPPPFQPGLAVPGTSRPTSEQPGPDACRPSSQQSGTDTSQTSPQPPVVNDASSSAPALAPALPAAPSPADREVSRPVALAEAFSIAGGSDSAPISSSMTLATLLAAGSAALGSGCCGGTAPMAVPSACVVVAGVDEEEAEEGRGVGRRSGDWPEHSRPSVLTVGSYSRGCTSSALPTPVADTSGEASPSPGSPFAGGFGNSALEFEEMLESIARACRRNDSGRYSDTSDATTALSEDFYGLPPEEPDWLAASMAPKARRNSMVNHLIARHQLALQSGMGSPAGHVGASPLGPTTSADSPSDPMRVLMQRSSFTSSAGLYEVLGGWEGLSTAVETLCHRLCGDPRLEGALDAMDSLKLKHRMLALLGLVLVGRDCPEDVRGWEAQWVAASDLPLSPEHFDVMIEHIMATLNELTGDRAVMEAASAILTRHRAILARRRRSSHSTCSTHSEDVTKGVTTALVGGTAPVPVGGPVAAGGGGGTKTSCAMSPTTTSPTAAPSVLLDRAPSSPSVRGKLGSSSSHMIASAARRRSGTVGEAAAILAHVEGLRVLSLEQQLS